MLSAQFEFLPDLNIFLAHSRRGGSFTCTFDPGQSVKHLIEAAGLPHTEIGQVFKDQEPIELDYQPQDNDTIAVAPPSPGQDLPPAGPVFVLDNHLGRLAAYLRMMGFDALYRNDLQDDELALISSREERILLTRDRHLLMRRSVRYGYCLRSLNSHQQAREVLRRYELSERSAPFRRCLRCNTLLESASKEAVIDQLEPLTRLYYEEFQRCPACGQIYWKGSHYEHMLALLDGFNSDQA